MERSPNLIDILEEVHMIFFDVQDNAVFRMEIQETVGVFAGFCQKYIGTAHADISSDGFQHTTHRDGRISFGFQQNVGNHGCCGCLSVGTADGDGSGIVVHELSQELGTGQHGDACVICSFPLGIIRMDGCRVNDQLNVLCDIGCALTDENLCAIFFQLFCQSGGFIVRTGYGKAFL